MDPTAKKTSQSEQKLANLLIQKKVLTPGQLKAALDYQRSLGGQISDVLLKLGLVRASQLEEVVKKLEGDEETKGSAATPNVLDPTEVKVSELKVHRRLLEKLPRELIEKHLIVLFFPSPHVGTRKIILGHGREIPPEVEEKVRMIAGVETCTLPLEESVAREFIEEHRPSEAPPSRKAAGPERSFRSVRPPGVPDEVVLNALLNVLTKRGLVTAEEIQIETEILGGK